MNKVTADKKTPPLTALLDAQGHGARARLAEAFNVTRQTVWRWEHGKTPIPPHALPVLLDMAKAEGIDMDLRDLVPVDPQIARRLELVPLRA
jgi:transcriptional regulator with XRE-family HTH domain